jgi:hypothetical protein
MPDARITTELLLRMAVARRTDVMRAAFRGWGADS